MSETPLKKPALAGTSFLDQVPSDLPEASAPARLDYAVVSRTLTEFSRQLLEISDLEAIRSLTVETVSRLVPAERVHLFLSSAESSEREIVEAFVTGGVRAKNRFASDQVLIAGIRGAGRTAAVLRIVNKLDWTAFDDEDSRVVEAIAGTLSLRLETCRLEQGLKNQVRSSIQALASAIEVKDRYTGGHTRRVYRYADAIASELPLTEEERERVRLAGLLHDIGKIGVPDRILQKPSDLTPAEWEEMKAHTESGYQIVSQVDGLEEIAEILRHHHERWDGGGYPRGLKGTAIPFASRILAVADAFDAMVTDRPYRRAMPVKEAGELIRSLAGTQFDPQVVEGFLRAFSRLTETS